MQEYFQKIFIVVKVIFGLCNIYSFSQIDLTILLEQIIILTSASLSTTIITAFFIGLVFSLQIVKEFLYLNAINLVGSVLTISFLRELSPVLTSVILIAKIGSYFTAELATMVVTEQIDVLYILGINPISYLIIPRIISLILILPILNFISFITSLLSCSFICYILYNIDPQIFFISSFSSLSLIDILKSCFKTIIFGFFISIISCVWGLTTKGGSKGVGSSTTSSVVTSLLIVFILDFILSYFMFDNLSSSLKIF
uniref:Conserved hypothetical plastid protein 63 n=1 Tax=Cumathamnion serrulatum TaxID=1206573 RepID=A0A7U1AR08_9FLOR|nr:conserved hypothetical plastid protein 63 [Cumathamnion serrulatum]QQY85300.1 conserved hypothetical plastid protein 63 [Cumathamnion serrulatum]